MSHPKEFNVCHVSSPRIAHAQGVGYGIVIGFGIFFSVFTSILVWLDYSFGGTRTTSEQFNTAGRSIKTGLIAVDIVSHWCDPASMAISRLSRLSITPAFLYTPPSPRGGWFTVGKTSWKFTAFE